MYISLIALQMFHHTCHIPVVLFFSPLSPLHSSPIWIHSLGLLQSYCLETFPLSFYVWSLFLGSCAILFFASSFTSLECILQEIPEKGCMGMSLHFQNLFLFFFFFKLFIYLYIYLWLCWVFVSVRGLSLVAASVGHSSLRCAGLSLWRPAEHRLQTRRLSNCGSRAQLLRGMWDLPRPGLEPVSLALAGRFSTTAPPGKPPKPFSTHSLIGL